MFLKDIKLGIIGLGYVGLPLAAEFGKHRSIIGFDINLQRISQLKNGFDATLELTKDELNKSPNLQFSNVLNEILDCNCYIITVPTPIDINNAPDLRPLISATEMVANVLSNGDIVIYESTVYPGATEEVCVPILEKNSNLEFNKDFYVGYSPERINPGDKQHRLADIIKVTSGSTPEVAELINELYKSIISAGTHKAESIKVAEAAKVIENTQRDVNIALINELALIFNKLEIDTEEVLAAASTKWNFLPFKPGLVGGHCIGVDPYYLTYKAQSIGYNPEIILAGRTLNDNMSNYVVSTLEEHLLKKDIDLRESDILIMGVTFKENCPDLRNSKVLDIIEHLSQAGAKVDTFDPWVDLRPEKSGHHFNCFEKILKNQYDGIILAVAHDQFIQLNIKDIKSLCKHKHVIYDLKYIFKKSEVEVRL